MRSVIGLVALAALMMACSSEDTGTTDDGAGAMPGVGGATGGTPGTGATPGVGGDTTTGGTGGGMTTGGTGGGVTTGGTGGGMTTGGTGGDMATGGTGGDMATGGTGGGMMASQECTTYCAAVYADSGTKCAMHLAASNPFTDEPDCVSKCAAQMNWDLTCRNMHIGFSNGADDHCFHAIGQMGQCADG